MIQGLAKLKNRPGTKREMIKSNIRSHHGQAQRIKETDGENQDLQSSLLLRFVCMRYMSAYSEQLGPFNRATPTQVLE